MNRIIGAIWGLVACGLLTLLLGSCGGHRTLVESVRYEHDTAYYEHDSLVCRYLTI